MPAINTNLLTVVKISLCALILPFANGLAAQGQSNETEFLDVDEAFQLNVDHSDTSTEVVWIIAPEYYLYKHKFSIQGIDRKTENRVDFNDSVKLSKGLRKNDGYYGMVEVLYYQAVASLGDTLQQHPQIDRLEVSYQGCANAGLCYPLQTKIISLIP